MWKCLHCKCTNWMDMWINNISEYYEIQIKHALVSKLLHTCSTSKYFLKNKISICLWPMQFKEHVWMPSKNKNTHLKEKPTWRAILNRTWQLESHPFPCQLLLCKTVFISGKETDKEWHLYCDTVNDVFMCSKV